MDLVKGLLDTIAALAHAADEAKANKGKAAALARKWDALRVTLREAERHSELGEAHRAPLQQILGLAKMTMQFLAQFAEKSWFRRAMKHDDDRRTFERLGFDLLAAQASLSLGLQVDAAAQQEELRLEIAAAHVDDDRHIEEALAELRTEQAAGFGDVGAKLDALLASGADGLDAYNYDPNDDDDSDQEESMLGQGAFAATHRMRSRGDGEVYAVKLIKLKKSGSTKEQLAEEAQRLKRLTHPSIVRYFGAMLFKRGKLFGIVMELLAGGSLEDRLADGPPTTSADAQRWGLSLASALEHIHGLGMLHRDLKPDNVRALTFCARLGLVYRSPSSPQIMFDEGGVPKIIDLGLACTLASKSKASSRVGTDLYMSPEKVRGEKYDGKDDVWALGCILGSVATATLLQARVPQSALALNRGKLRELVDETAAASPLVGKAVRGMLSTNALRRPDAAGAQAMLRGLAPPAAMHLVEEGDDEDADAVRRQAAREILEAERRRVAAAQKAEDEAAAAMLAAREAEAADRERAAARRADEARRWVAAAAGSPERDRQALEALYHATGGATRWDRSKKKTKSKSWFCGKASAWLVGDDVSTWPGVTVSQGRVTKLDLGGFGLAGMSLAAIGSLAALTRLDLRNNPLIGAWPLRPPSAALSGSPPPPPFEQCLLKPRPTTRATCFMEASRQRRRSSRPCGWPRRPRRRSASGSRRRRPGRPRPSAGGRWRGRPRRRSAGASRPSRPRPSASGSRRRRPGRPRRSAGGPRRGRPRRRSGGASRPSRPRRRACAGRPRRAPTGATRARSGGHSPRA